MNELDPKSEAERAWMQYLLWATARRVDREGDPLCAVLAVAIGFLGVLVALVNAAIGLHVGRWGWISYIIAAFSLIVALACFRWAFKWLPKRSR